MIEENRKKRVTMTQETINKILKLKLLILLPPKSVKVSLLKVK